MSKSSPILFLELNELNFEFVSAYGVRGELPNLSALLGRVGYAETVSEERHESLEPWIQWVTAHTGLSFADHGIFRLGDIVTADLPQIWEELSAHGLTAGAISPMNAKCRSRDLAFFLPDPWTKTDLICRPLVRRMFEGIRQAVLDNAEAKMSARSLINVTIGAATIARARNYAAYLHCIATAPQRPWNKAIFLDQLLADLFVSEVQRNRPDFASLFLNAAAHIQHHYMFSSAVYDGDQKNPDWYVTNGSDPLLDVYRTYDRIVGDVIALFPQSRIMLATGLHQDPHPDLTYYWRLRDHAAFLRKIGARFVTVDPLMSRDFVVKCHSQDEAEATASVLCSAKSLEGSPIFNVDNRGQDLFVALVYSDEIVDNMPFMVGNVIYNDLKGYVAFVAIKNGRHNGVGYFVDSGRVQSPKADLFPLREMPLRIKAALGVA